MLSNRGPKSVLLASLLRDQSSRELADDQSSRELADDVSRHRDVTALEQRFLSERILPSSTPGAGARARRAPGVRAPTGRRARRRSVHGAEILWDEFGVPHLYSGDVNRLLCAYGWAQAHSHGDLLLRLYGRARGRAAEYWGEGPGGVWLTSDRRAFRLGIAARARAWYEAQYATSRRMADAFADGINRYAREHGDRLADDAKLVLPLSGVDVFALIQYTFHFHFVFNPEAISSGSNAWAIAPSRSCQRRPLLLANPHLPWGDLYTFYEAHLVLADGSLDIYGASLVGLPFIAIGFNRHLGWTHTVNTQDGADLYALVPTDGGYKWDNEAGVLPFQIKEHTLRVKQPSGDLREEQVVVRSSVHGPVIVETESAPIALRMVGLDQPFMFEQYWDMMRAVDLRDFEAAIRHLQIPTFMILYADRDGHIMSLFGGRTPVRPPGPWNWQGIVPGDTSQALWTETLGYDALPRVVDPPTGWVQNANDPPWTTTLPPALDPTRFPAYLAPHFMDFRAQRSAQILSEFDRISLDELICLKHSTRLELADRILDDLLAAARASGSEVARAGADALLAWDRTTDADSRAALVFDFWVKEMPWQNVVFASSDVFAIPWDERHPITTPRGLRDPAVAVAALERAATRILTQYGSLAAAAGPPPGPAIDPRWLPLYLPWGAIHRLRRDSLDLPANGAHDRLGLMRVFEYVPSPVGGVPIYQVVQGDSFIFAAELGEPRRARVLLSYGNSSQPGSPHRTDQLPYVARKELRSARLERRDIEAHAVWRCVV